MYASNNLRPKFNFLGIMFGFLALLFMAGCSVDPPMERPGVNEQGSFYVRSFSGLSKQTSYDEDYGIPKARIYDFKVCIKDLASRNDVIKHSFFIDGGNETIHTTTDENGCFVWTEEIEFNFLAQSQYVTQKRTIRSDGVQRGVDVVEFAVNPWRRGEDEKAVYDLKLTKNVPGLVSLEDTKMALKGDSVREAVLWVEKLDYANVSEGRLTEHGYLSDMELHLKLKLKVKDVYGQWQIYDLKRGTFNVTPYLINKKQLKGGLEERNVLTINDKAKSEKIGIDGLKVNTHIYIPLVPTRGDIELGLIIEPQNSKKSLSVDLKSFHGIFQYGQFDSLVGNHPGKLKKIVMDNDKKFKSKALSFDLHNYVDTKAIFVRTAFAGYKKHKKKMDKLRKDGRKEDVVPFKFPSGWQCNKYVFQELQIKFQSYSVKALPEQEVIFNVKACVKNVFTKKTVEGYDFTIHKIEKDADGKRKTIVETSKDGGCMKWTDKIRFKVYDKEHYIIEDLIVENEELDIHEALKVAINPWDFGFTFGQDAHYNSELTKDQNLDSKPSSEIWVPGFGYRNLGFDYRIDENLNLILKKHMIIRIDPFFKAYHSLTRVRPIYPLYPGKYLMKLVLIRNYNEDPHHMGEYISHVEKLVSVFQGRIQTQVTFEIDDIRLMGSRNILMVDIFPVYEDRVIVNSRGHIVPKDPELRGHPELWNDNLVAWDSGLKSKTYLGPILVLNETGGSSFLEASEQTRLNSMSQVNAEKIMKGGGRSIISQDVAEDFLKNVNIVSEDEVTAEQEDPKIIEKIHGENGKIYPVAKSDPRSRVLRINSNKNAGGKGLILENIYSLDDPKVQDKLVQLFNCGPVKDKKGRMVEKCVHDDSSINKDKNDGLYDLVPFKYIDERTKIERIGYAPPPFDTDTTTMIKRAKLIVEMKKKIVDESSKLKHYLKQNNLKHIVMNDEEQADKFLFNLANPYWHMSEEKGFAGFIKERNDPYFNVLDIIQDMRGKLEVEPKENFNKDEIIDLIENGVMTKKMANVFCNFWFNNLLRNTVSDGQESFIKKPFSFVDDRWLGAIEDNRKFDPLANYKMMELCRKQVESPWNIFAVERKWRVKEFGDFYHNRGLSINMAVSNAVNMGYGESHSVSKNFHYGVTAGTDKFPGIKKLPIPFNVGAGFTKTFSRSKQVNNGLSSGSNTSINLVVQRNEFTLGFKKYEKCVSIKINPLGFRMNANDETVMYVERGQIGWNEELIPDDKANLLTKGLFICTGEDIDEPTEVRENFYYITQHFNVGHAIDTPSIKNRWFDVALRGKHTFTTFISLLYAEQYYEFNNREVWAPVATEEAPLESLLPIYKNIPTSYYKIYSVPENRRRYEKFDWTMEKIDKAVEENKVKESETKE